MKQNTYCLMSPIGELDPLYASLYSIKNKLRTCNIAHTLPALRWHITHVSPFLATTQEMKWLAIGLELGKSLSPITCREQLIRGTTFDFYRGNDEDTFILRLETSEEFRSVVARIRARVENITDMKYVPKSFQVNFHVSIAAGKGLARDIENCDTISSFLETVPRRIVTELQYPTIVVKQSGCWSPVSL